MPGHPSGARAEPQDPQAQGLVFLGAAPQKGWRVREKRGPTQVLILAHSHPPRQHSWPTDLRWNFDIFKEGTQNTRPLSVGHGAGATCPRLEVEQSLVSQICTCFPCVHLVFALDQEFNKEEDDIATFSASAADSFFMLDSYPLLCGQQVQGLARFFPWKRSQRNAGLGVTLVEIPRKKLKRKH